MLRLFALLLLLPGMTFSQTAFGVKAGLNVSDIVMTNYVNPDVEGDFLLKAGLHAGIFASGIVADKFGLAAELLYSDKGVKGSTNIHLHYITLPILFQYKLTDRIMAELGPELAYMVSAVSRHGNVSGTYNNKFDLSLDGGFRLDISRLLFGIRYCAGVFSVRDPIEPGTPGVEKIKYQNRVLQLTVGYKIVNLE